MAMTIEEMLAKRPVDRAVVDWHKKWMLDEVRAYRLRELREASELAQVQLAGRLHVPGIGCAGSSTVTLTGRRSIRLASMLKLSGQAPY